MSSSADTADGLLVSSSNATETPAASRREARKLRSWSLSEVATLLDRDRGVVTGWMHDGCPHIQKADKAAGKPWILDVADVVRWLESRSAEEAAERLGGGGPDGSVKEGEAKRRRAVAQAIIAEAEASEILRTLARWSTITDRVAADYGELRSRLMAISDAVAGKVERRQAAKIRELVDDQVRNALAALRVDRDLEKAAPAQAA